MSHKLASSVRTVDRILKSGLFTGNCNFFAQAQPKSLESRQFLSLSSGCLSRLPKGLVKPIGPKEVINGATNVGEKGAADQNVGVKGNNAPSTLWSKSAPKTLNQQDPQSPLLLTPGEGVRKGDTDGDGRDKEMSSDGPD